MAAIATTNGKLAIMELDLDWEPGLPLSTGAIGQDDQQQLLWGFPEVLWGEFVEPETPTPVRRFDATGRGTGTGFAAGGSAGRAFAAGGRGAGGFTADGDGDD